MLETLRGAVSPQLPTMFTPRQCSNQRRTDVPSRSGTSHISEPSEEHGTLFQAPPLLSACFPLAVISYIPLSQDNRRSHPVWAPPVRRYEEPDEVIARLVRRRQNWKLLMTVLIHLVRLERARHSTSRHLHLLRKNLSRSAMLLRRRRLGPPRLDCRILSLWKKMELG